MPPISAPIGPGHRRQVLQITEPHAVLWFIVARNRRGVELLQAGDDLKFLVVLHELLRQRVQQDVREVRRGDRLRRAVEATAIHLQTIDVSRAVDVRLTDAAKRTYAT